jgi:hypothetical protein
MMVQKMPALPRIAAVVLLVLSCACPLRADPKSEAREQFEQGLELADAGEFELAVRRFERAYELMPHHDVLYNIGQTYVALDRPVEAADALSRYLEEGGEAVPAERREEAKREIERQQARIAELTLTVTPTGSTITLDGRALGQSPLESAVRVAAGSHEVTASHDGFESSSEQFTVSGAEQATIHLDLEPLESNTESAAPPPPTAAQEPLVELVDVDPVEPEGRSGDHRSRRVAVIATAAGAVALGATTVGVWAWNDKRHRDWEDEQRLLKQIYSEPEIPNPDAIAKQQDANDELLESVHRSDRVVVGLGIASGALLATSAALYLTDRASQRQGMAVSFGANHAAVTLHARF